MNKAREELCNMRQMEHESISVYMYRWGRALYRSSGIRPSEERHPHIIKDSISWLKKNIRNKIANRWAEMWHPPNTVERALELASDVEKQLQVADSFKLDFPTHPSRELNEMSTEETSGDEQEVNEITRNKKWVSNSSNYNQKRSNFNNNRNSNYRHQQQWPQENKQTKQWMQKLRDSKITLTQESNHRLRYGWMVKALACQVEGPGFKSHYGKSFGKVLEKKKKKKKKKKKPAILCLHDGSPDDGSAPQLVKRPGCVLSCLYDWCT